MAGCAPYESERSRLFFDTLVKFNEYRRAGSTTVPWAKPLSCDDYKGNMTVVWDRIPELEQQVLAATIWSELFECAIRHMVITEVPFDSKAKGIGDDGTCIYAHAGFATRSSD